MESPSLVRDKHHPEFEPRAHEDYRSVLTEEFLREARRSADLAEEHRSLLSAFLEGCDRVKFARHCPDERESKEAIAVARRFLEETRLIEDPTASQEEEEPKAA